MTKSIFIFISAVSFALAQWPSDPDINLQISKTNISYGWDFAATSDGNNGVISVWADTRKGTQTLYAQRVDDAGNLLWDSMGVEISVDSLQSFSPAVLSDGEGGVFIVWEKNIGSGNLYGQRMNAFGEKLWADTGVVICSATRRQSSPKIISDADGGIIITWTDNRGAFGTYDDIYVQRVDQNGIAIWPKNGIMLHSNKGEERYPEIIPDGNGGAIFCWWTLGQSIFTQKIDVNGNLKWGGGKRTSLLPTNYPTKTMVSDNAGGAILFWSSGQDISAQRVDSSGSLVWGDTAEIVLDFIDGAQDIPNALADGEGGAYVVWRDARPGANNAFIYLQHFNANGDQLWTPGGVSISNFNTYIPTPLITKAPDNSVYIAWEDTRSSQYLWTQRINPDSSHHYQYGGVQTAKGVANWSDHKIFTTEEGSMIAVFSDGNDIRAKKIHPDGSLGTVTTIADNSLIKLSGFNLYQNYPNPFNPKTVIRYYLTRASNVELTVYDLSGKEIKTIVNTKQASGDYKIVFNAENFSSGVYFYTLKTDNQTLSRKMILLK
ncbi:MAG: T9SS C-terminal target domain-containing protein [Calditrichaeota bacterium]|nr:MAG: T9SS C-terminal target domain-containing protein [Calditrichota bacterium]MBL1207866.1 T9SS C-terminal target domain-containing protein [Calditrichota bacterium]NOG47701.1 T9SS type A sorting domain-containing protein [Calditrichota bacterium]